MTKELESKPKRVIKPISFNEKQWNIIKEDANEIGLEPSTYVKHLVAKAREEKNRSAN